MSITIEMIQGMNKEERASLAHNLEFELDRLYDTKDEMELYYDLDDAGNLACYHEIIRKMDDIYEILLRVNRI
jgi:hypothetical protein